MLCSKLLRQTYLEVVVGWFIEKEGRGSNLLEEGRWIGYLFGGCGRLVLSRKKDAYQLYLNKVVGLGLGEERPVSRDVGIGISTRYQKSDALRRCETDF